MDVIGQLEFVRAYYDVAVQQVSQHTMKTSPLQRLTYPKIIGK